MNTVIHAYTYTAINTHLTNTAYAPYIPHAQPMLHIQLHKHIHIRAIRSNTIHTYTSYTHKCRPYNLMLYSRQTYIMYIHIPAIQPYAIDTHTPYNINVPCATHNTS
ncbi:hypothetical protein EON63_23145 [archaeon]|nr:MAG: hypothetical protein EON63_23145 [archaeon]